MIFSNGSEEDEDESESVSVVLENPPISKSFLRNADASMYMSQNLNSLLFSRGLESNLDQDRTLLNHTRTANLSSINNYDVPTNYKPFIDTFIQSKHREVTPQHSSAYPTTSNLKPTTSASIFKRRTFGHHPTSPAGPLDSKNHVTFPPYVAYHPELPSVLINTTPSVNISNLSVANALDSNISRGTSLTHGFNGNSNVQGTSYDHGASLSTSAFTLASASLKDPPPPLSPPHPSPPPPTPPPTLPSRVADPQRPPSPLPAEAVNDPPPSTSKNHANGSGIHSQPPTIRAPATRTPLNASKGSFRDLARQVAATQAATAAAAAVVSSCKQASVEHAKGRNFDDKNCDGKGRKNNKKPTNNCNPVDENDDVVKKSKPSNSSFMSESTSTRPSPPSIASLSKAKELPVVPTTTSPAFSPNHLVGSTSSSLSQHPASAASLRQRLGLAARPSSPTPAHRKVMANSGSMIKAEGKGRGCSLSQRLNRNAALFAHPLEKSNKASPAPNSSTKKSAKRNLVTGTDENIPAVPHPSLAEAGPLFSDPRSQPPTIYELALRNPQTSPLSRQCLPDLVPNDSPDLRSPNGAPLTANDWDTLPRKRLLSQFDFHAPLSAGSGCGLGSVWNNSSTNSAHAANQTIEPMGVKKAQEKVKAAFRSSAKILMDSELRKEIFNVQEVSQDDAIEKDTMNYGGISGKQYENEMVDDNSRDTNDGELSLRTALLKEDDSECTPKMLQVTGHSPPLHAKSQLINALFNRGSSDESNNNNNVSNIERGALKNEAKDAEIKTGKMTVTDKFHLFYSHQPEDNVIEISSDSDDRERETDQTDEFFLDPKCLLNPKVSGSGAREDKSAQRIFKSRSLFEPLMEGGRLAPNPLDNVLDRNVFLSGPNASVNVNSDMDSESRKCLKALLNKAVLELQYLRQEVVEHLDDDLYYHARDTAAWLMKQHLTAPSAKQGEITGNTSFGRLMNDSAVEILNKSNGICQSGLYPGPISLGKRKRFKWVGQSLDSDEDEGNNEIGGATKGIKHLDFSLPKSSLQGPPQTLHCAKKRLQYPSKIWDRRSTPLDCDALLQSSGLGRMGSKSSRSRSKSQNCIASHLVSSFLNVQKPLRILALPISNGDEMNRHDSTTSAVHFILPALTNPQHSSRRVQVLRDEVSNISNLNTAAFPLPLAAAPLSGNLLPSSHLSLQPLLPLKTLAKLSEGHITKCLCELLCEYDGSKDRCSDGVRHVPENLPKRLSLSQLRLVYIHENGDVDSASGFSARSGLLYPSSNATCDGLTSYAPPQFSSGTHSPPPRSPPPRFHTPSPPRSHTPSPPPRSPGASPPRDQPTTRSPDKHSESRVPSLPPSSISPNKKRASRSRHNKSPGSYERTPGSLCKNVFGFELTGSTSAASIFNAGSKIVLAQPWVEVEVPSSIAILQKFLALGCDDDSNKCSIIQEYLNNCATLSSINSSSDKASVDRPLKVLLAYNVRELVSENENG